MTEADLLAAAKQVNEAAPDVFARSSVMDKLRDAIAMHENESQTERKAPEIQVSVHEKIPRRFPRVEIDNPYEHVKVRIVYELEESE